MTPEMRAVLRGHDLLNNQKQLEDLAKLNLSEDVRLNVARLIVDGEAKTVKAAHLVASGKADAKTKNAFLIIIEDEIDG